MAQTDAKLAKEILTKMNNLEKTMDDVFPDLIEQVQGISKRLDDLNADFFTKIFRDVLQQELKLERDHSADKVLKHLDNFKTEIIDSHHCSHHKREVYVQTDDAI